MFTTLCSFLLFALVAALALALAPDGKITGSIREGGRAFRAGQESDLLKIATPEQLARWKKQGLIAGNWGVEAETTGSGSGTSDQSTPPELEPIAAQISSSLGITRNSDETSVQFLTRFANTATEVAEELSDRERAASEATQRLETARQELDTLQSRYDSLVTNAGAVERERDTLRTEVETLRGRLAELDAAAQSTPAGPEGEGAASTGKTGKK